jgi:hypothetical protein
MDIRRRRYGPAAARRVCTKVVGERQREPRDRRVGAGGAVYTPSVLSCARGGPDPVGHFP